MINKIEIKIQELVSISTIQEFKTQFVQLNEFFLSEDTYFDVFEDKNYRYYFMSILGVYISKK